MEEKEGRKVDGARMENTHIYLSVCLCEVRLAIC